MEVRPAIKEFLDELISVRRELHKIPEESGKEYKTQLFVESYLKKLGLKPVRIATGVYADISGKTKAAATALRADIDALPITEKTPVDYASQNGFMHACGHDGHTSMLLLTAKYLTQNPPDKPVRVIFQFGEEGVGGARVMIDGGCLKGVGSIYAMHLSPELEKGRLSTCMGAMFAGTVEFDIIIEGVSAHCAEPEKGRDAVKATLRVLAGIDKIRERYKNNTVIHTGKISAGTARNVIAGKSELLMTLRFYNEDDREAMMMEIARLLADTDNEFGTVSSIVVESVYPPLINSSIAVSNVRRLVPDIKECSPKFTAEDFSEYLLEMPGCMAWLGVKDETFCSPLHSDTFGFCENSLLYGVEYFARIAENGDL